MPITGPSIGPSIIAGHVYRQGEFVSRSSRVRQTTTSWFVARSTCFCRSSGLIQRTSSAGTTNHGCMPDAVSLPVLPHVFASAECSPDFSHEWRARSALPTSEPASWPTAVLPERCWPRRHRGSPPRGSRASWVFLGASVRPGEPSAHVAPRLALPSGRTPPMCLRQKGIDR